MEILTSASLEQQPAVPGGYRGVLDSGLGVESESGPVKPSSALKALTKITHIEYILRPCALWDMNQFLLLSISRATQHYNDDHHIFMMEIHHINDDVIHFHIAKLCMTCGIQPLSLIERELKTFSVSCI